MKEPCNKISIAGTVPGWSCQQNRIIFYSSNITIFHIHNTAVPCWDQSCTQQTLSKIKTSDLYPASSTFNTDQRIRGWREEPHHVSEAHTGWISTFHGQPGAQTKAELSLPECQANAVTCLVSVRQLLCGTKPKPIPALNRSQSRAGCSQRGRGRSSGENPAGWKQGRGKSQQEHAQLPGKPTCLGFF